TESRPRRDRQRCRRRRAVRWRRVGRRRRTGERDRVRRHRQGLRGAAAAGTRCHRGFRRLRGRRSRLRRDATMRDALRKRVYIAYTGGTIGMRHTRSGYRPEPGYLQQQMRAMPELRQASMPSTTVNEYEPLLDSSNMTPAEWIEIARDIGRNYKKYDGFLVLHGTDTMAYTASALPFMLNGLGKPVI